MPKTKFPSAPAKALIAAAMAVILVNSALAAPKYKVLHAFGSGTDGGGLWGSLAFDANGNLYGTTSGGGVYGDGTVFELTPGSNGRWSETILHSFPSFPEDGGAPFSTPILDAAGTCTPPPTAGFTIAESSLNSRMAPGPRPSSTTSAPNPSAATEGRPAPPWSWTGLGIFSEPPITPSSCRRVLAYGN